MPNWPQRYLDLADTVALWSKDRSTKVGAVIVGEAGQILATGYNGFPRGVNDDYDERHDRPAKYLWSEHAERNAIYNAARSGIALVGSTLYVSWHPCADCARGIVQSGISTVVMSNIEMPERWRESAEVGSIMFREAGLDVIWLNEGTLYAG